MKLHTFFAATLMITLSVACRGNNDAGAATLDATASTDTSVAVVADTTSIDKNSELKVKKDTVIVPDFATAQEAVDWMMQSADSAKYAAGVLPKIAFDDLGYTVKLLRNSFDYFIVVDKPSMYVVLFDKYGREKQSYKMACARNYGTKHKKSDCRTPEGFFKAEGIYNSTDWLYTNDAGYTSPTRGVYGPRFIRLDTPVTRTVGIHGTNGPGSLGRRASHGCIRLHNNSILDLVKYVKPGMPIIVNPSDRDQQVNKREGYKVVRINIGKPTVTEPIASPDKKKSDADSVKSVMADTATHKAEAAPIATENPVDEPTPAVEEEQTEG